ncbi:MAG: lysophospholipid acyltransferase family protein [Candidatus Omnitrophica bacterium]|nr:lysophospholipid acyltransferase family protein [Candidatus Omnitrophota bacterium]
MKKKPRHLVEYVLLRVVMGLINFFPISVSTWITRRIGDVMFLLAASRRRVALENLNVAFGNSKSDREKKRLALESFRHFITSFMEFSRIPKFVKDSAQRFRFSGTEHLKQAFARGRGLILVMSHLGPWEYLAFLAYLKRVPSMILGKRIRNPYLYKWVKSLRNMVNLKHTDKDEGVRKVISELRQNHLVGIVIDQWAGNEESWVDFFGVPASTTSLPVRLARKTGCALIPAYCIRVASGKYEIHVYPEVVLREDRDNWAEEVTRELNYLLEQQVRAFPEQWIWTHRRWKGKKSYIDNNF